MKKRKIFLFVGIFIILTVGILTYKSGFFSTGELILAENVEIIPLSVGEREKVFQTIISSEFIKDVPEENPIALTFYDFENNEVRHRDGFLIGKNQLLSEGDPAVYLALHSKYISEINEENICETIKIANKNRDLQFQSKYSKAKLLLKYKSMLKHRNCFGF